MQPTKVSLNLLTLSSNGLYSDANMPYLYTSGSVVSIFQLSYLDYNYANFWNPNTDIGRAHAHCWNNWINSCPQNCLHWLRVRPGTLFGLYQISYCRSNAAEMWRWPFQLSLMSILKRIGLCLHSHMSSWPGLLLTRRRLTSYIYGAPILDVSRSHTTTQHSR